MDPQTSVEVAIRVKPTQESHLIINQPFDIRCGSKSFTFDYIFPPSSTQNDIFVKIGTKVVNNVTNGYNSCIFAYGQTGSGKTFTMSGNDENDGLIQECMNSLWSILQSYENFEIKLSYYELYNEQINDLLIDKKKAKFPIKLKESLALGFYLENITQTKVESCQQMINELKKGLRNRSVAETKMNSVSSRSHSILTLKIVTRDVTLNKVKSSKIHFVDLAGSEKQKMTEVFGDRLKQASKINRSLTLLSIVIEKLANNSTHIPYRDSILTKILKDSLGGNSKTILLATVAASEAFFSQTLSTLNFAAKAKNIKLNARVNEEMDEKNIVNLQKIIKSLEQEIKALKIKQNSCGNCQNVQRQYEILERKYQNFEQTSNKKITQLSQFRQTHQKENIFLESQLKIKQIQFHDLQFNVQKSAQNYLQLIESFRGKVRSQKFNDFQKELFYAQQKKIKQLEDKIKKDKRKWEKKQEVYKYTINRLKVTQEDTTQEKQQSQQSKLSKMSIQTVNMKKIQSQLETMNVLRATDSAKLEFLETQNNRLKLAVEQANETKDFIRKLLEKKLYQQQNEFKLELDRMNDKYFEDLQLEKSKLIEEYYESLNSLRQENKKKDRDLYLNAQWTKLQENSYREGVEKLRSEKSKLDEEKKNLAKQKKEFEFLDRKMRNILMKISSLVKLDITQENFYVLVEKIYRRINYLLKVETEKQKKPQKLSYDDYCF